jgi:hypothetical protein
MLAIVVPWIPVDGGEMNDPDSVKGEEKGGGREGGG